MKMNKSKLSFNNLGVCWWSEGYTFSAVKGYSQKTAQVPPFFSFNPFSDIQFPQLLIL